MNWKEYHPSILAGDLSGCEHGVVVEEVMRWLASVRSISIRANQRRLDVLDGGARPRGSVLPTRAARNRSIGGLRRPFLHEAPRLLPQRREDPFVAGDVDRFNLRLLQCFGTEATENSGIE